MSVSKKLKIAKQLFGESKEEFEQAHEKGKESAKQTNPRCRARSFAGAIQQERGAITKQRRAIKIQREAIEGLASRNPKPA